MESVHNAIQSTQGLFGEASVTHLQEAYQKLQKTVESLHASLRIPDEFPELQGANLEFSRNLLLARDLKMLIRKKAIAGFFEVDKLDQATGGRHQPLGSARLLKSSLMLS